MVQESYGVNAFRAFVIFHLYPIKIAFSQKFRLPVGIFLLFLKIPCILEISSTKKAPALRPVLLYYICTATDGSSVSTVSSLFLISLSFFTILYRPTVRRGTRRRTMIA